MTGSQDRWRSLLQRRFRAPLLTISLGIGLFSFNEFLVSTALPSAIRDTGGIALMSWAITLYLVPSIVSGSCAAFLKQRLGARAALFLSGLLFLAGTLVASAAPSMPMILCGRALQGAGDGVIAALCYALIPALFPPNLIARVFGIEAMVWAASAFGGPLLSGWMTQAFSWRAAFLVNVPLIAGFLLLVPRVAPKQSQAEATASGAALLRLCAIAMGIVAVALTDILPGLALRAGCLGFAVAVLIWAVRADRSSRTRLFPATMFRLSSRSGAIYWTILLMPLAQAVSGVYLVLALQAIWRLHPAVAGAFVALMAISWSAAAVLTAGLPVWRARLARIGPALNLAGLAGLLIALQTGWLALVIVSQIAIGAGFGLSWATFSQSVMQDAAQDAPKDAAPGERDRASALVPTVQSAGYAIGAAIAGLAANTAGLPHALASGALAAPISWAYGVAVMIALAAVLTSSRADVARFKAAPDPSPGYSA